MNLHHLKIFLGVAEAGSISAGAERLHISQPAVTREIRDLEASIGLPLFDRHPRGVALTESGARLLQYARRIFALEQAAERDLRGFASLHLGELALGASATLGAYLLPALLDRFRGLHPRIVVSLEVSNTLEVTRQLDDGRISLGFVEGEFERGDYAHRLLARDALLPVAGPAHPLAALTGLSVHDLQRHDLYLREQGSGARASIEQAYQILGLEPRARMTIGSTEALKRLIANGSGIAWLSQRVVETELNAGQLVRLDVGDLRIERDLYMLWRHDGSLSPAPAAFVELVAQAL
ncbi:LysR family transcriptional regulator [Phytopseudomonas dryadis]|uniref:LysR family transcriptional regulator n=1 Tax=Phytopseudomonas dryadis TaxID=2487520 RepID=A0ABY1Z1U0_9GAMM|nr:MULTISPECIES: LysR family transcriptional regulator [Pseudomonas]TBV01923.1 LysR family transcriptional regulator [Pseudomonas dryadis]TBV13858.1 LysR family transcriptional regulator [Pseudomonas sp. FRB 230]